MDPHRGRLSVRVQENVTVYGALLWTATRSQHDSGLCLIDEGRDSASVSGMAVGL